MTDLSTSETPAQASGDRLKQLSHLRHMIEHAAHLLPAQGPITVFVHHNTLHAFEELSFEEGVVKGGRIFGAEPYLPEDRYREMLTRERIRIADLETVLRDDLDASANEKIPPGGTRFELQMAMLQFPLRMAPDPELRWLVAETDALRRFRRDVPENVRMQVIDETRHWVMRDLRNGEGQRRNSEHRRIRQALSDLIERFGKTSIERWSDATWEAFCLGALWRACQQGVHGIGNSTPPAPAPVRHRDVLLRATGADSDPLVHEILIRFCAAFLDQGFADWSLPSREDGFYRSFLNLYSLPYGPPDRWVRELRADLLRLSNSQRGPLESIAESLELLGVGSGEQEAFISQTLLALRGWAGMIWQIETRGDRVPRPAPQESLVEYLAVRLILERFALAHVARESLGFSGPLRELRQAARSRTPRRESPTSLQRAFLAFRAAQIMGWKPETLFGLSRAEWSKVLEDIETFSHLERRRIFHLAYERRYYVQALDAYAAAANRAVKARPRPRFQLFCCIDDREESYRRHLEEVAPDVETFGTAAFYNVVMYYRGAADAHFTPLCPIVVRPRHWVVEGVVYPLEEDHRRRTRTRRMLGTALHRLHMGSRSFVTGVLTALFGSLTSIPLITRVLFPRATAQFRRRFGRIVEPPPVRQLVLERTADDPGPEPGHWGFSVGEMADIVERTLRDVGLTSGLARLVIMTGHGSSSVNNPHESAYNCGACAGARGGPNARAFAQMANDPRVRARLAQHGLEIPSDTHFIGTYHNTCDDSVTYFDLDRLPPSHRTDFERARRDIDAARQRNAHERCRRFESAPLDLSFEAALRHVENRSEDLAQTRPEYNHATNTITFVGRRSRVRGLFLDRRTFLTSYDPTQDDEEHTILLRNLQSVVPVCAGISLEYYFSCVDPVNYGCNNKLPHNVASMLGVMLGAASDLQPGLNMQMIEIHEPIRQLFIVETTPEAMLEIIETHAAIGRVCRNGWVQVATLDPDSSAIHVYHKGRFHLYHPETDELPEVDSSVDWYRGWRDHLGFATVKDAPDDSTPTPQIYAETAESRS